MNKLFYSDRINNKNITLTDKDIDVKICGNSKIFNIENNINNFNIYVENDSTVLIEDFRIIDKYNTNITININNNSTLIYNHSFINEDEYNLNILINYQGNNSKVIFNINGINDKGLSNIKADGILGNNINNQLLENINVININKGKGIIIPNILVNNNEVVADHAATIGKINRDHINYLMSKGISYEQSKRLILNGFLINIFKSNDFIMKIKEIINWR